jgi:hypothetical protein
MEHIKRHAHGHLGVGIFLLIAGIALLLENFDVLTIGPVWRFWPVIILVLGLGRLLDAQEAWEYQKAAWWIFIGSWLLISELHLFGLTYHNSWPILLVGVGVGMLWKSAYPSHFKSVKDHCHGN